MDHPPRDILIERLEALERENRWIWRVGAGTVVAAIIFLAGATTLLRPPKIVEAQGFVLKDPSGRVRGEFRTMLGGAPEFSLNDEDGNDLVNLQTTNWRSSSINLFSEGHPLIQLSASPDGSALLKMADDKENRLAMYLRQDGAAGQSFEGSNGRFHAGVQPDGMAGICVVDELGREIDRLGLLPDEVQCVRVNDIFYQPGPAPFRTRPAAVTGDSPPLRELFRQAERAEAEIRAELRPQVGASSPEILH